LKELPGRLLPQETRRPQQLVTYLNTSIPRSKRTSISCTTQETLLQAPLSAGHINLPATQQIYHIDSLVATALRLFRPLWLPLWIQSFCDLIVWVPPAESDLRRLLYSSIRAQARATNRVKLLPLLISSRHRPGEKTEPIYPKPPVMWALTAVSAVYP
jgi:hypothetical protein